MSCVCPTCTKPNVVRSQSQQKMKKIFKPFKLWSFKKEYDNLSLHELSIMIQNQNFQIRWIIISWWIVLLAWLIVAAKVYSNDYPNKCQSSSNNNPSQTLSVKTK